MDLSNLQPNTPRKYGKRIGRGGKRGTYSGKGMKGQKSRAGASIKTGFRGGDNRLWQLFPKQRGASKKPGGGGNNGPHRKHRYFQLKHSKAVVFNLDFFNKFSEKTINPLLLVDKGLIANIREKVKILGDGNLKKGISFEGFSASKSAKQKINEAGGSIK